MVALWPKNNTLVVLISPRVAMRFLFQEKVSVVAKSFTEVLSMSRGKSDPESPRGSQSKSLGVVKRLVMAREATMITKTRMSAWLDSRR